MKPMTRYIVVVVTACAYIIPAIHLPTNTISESGGSGTTISRWKPFKFEGLSPDAELILPGSTPQEEMDWLVNNGFPVIDLNDPSTYEGAPESLIKELRAEQAEKERKYRLYQQESERQAQERRELYEQKHNQDKR